MPSTNQYHSILTRYHQVSTNTNLYSCCFGITDSCTVYPRSSSFSNFTRATILQLPIIQQIKSKTLAILSQPEKLSDVKASCSLIFNLYKPGAHMQLYIFCIFGICICICSCAFNMFQQHYNHLYYLKVKALKTSGCVFTLP